ncbi:hypothetical protein Tco_0542277 [Tanacetum coccineum]
MRNEDLCTKLEYFSEKYDEEREMEPRPTRTRETTLVLCAGSLRVRIQRERVVEFKDAPKRDGSRVERNPKGGRPSEQRAKDSRNQGMNLHPLLTTHLGRNGNGQHLQLQPSTGPIPTYVNPYSQPNMGISYGQPLSYHSHAQGGNCSFGGTFAYHSYEGYASQVPTSNHVPAYSRLMYPSTAPSNNYPFYTQPIHSLPNTPAYPNHSPTGLFRDFTGCVTPFVCWIEDYPLPGGLKMPSQVHSYDEKGDPDNYFHLFEGAIHDTLQILGLHKEQRISGFVHGLKIRSLVEFLSTDLPTNYKGLMKTNYTWIKAKEVATNRAPNDHRESVDRFKKNSSWDNHKGKKNKDRELKHQIEEAVKLGQLAHLVKGIKKGKAKNWGPVSGINNSSDPDILKAQISGRYVNQVYTDSGSSYEVIYEHCFLKLKPSNRLLRVDSKVLLVGFSGEHSWPLGEVPLEIIVGNNPFTRTKVLNFVIVRSNSPQNMLLRRIVMQRMGIVVSMIHGAIKFHTPNGIGTVFSTYKPDVTEERQKKLKETLLETAKVVLSYVDTQKKGLSNADVFAWTYTNMTGTPRTIMVGGKPFNTEYRLNEFKHIEQIKQKKRGLAPERNKAICKKGRGAYEGQYLARS